MGFFDFFRKPWQRSDPEERKAAIRELSDQSVLAELARNDPDTSVRLLAVQHITDPETLQEFLAHSDMAIRLQAIEVCRDHETLRGLVLNEAQPKASAAAIRRLTNIPAPHVLIEAIEQSSLPSALKIAGRLSEHTSRTYVIEGQRAEVRERAFQNVHKPTHLVQIACKAPDLTLALRALEGLQDPDRRQVFQNSKHPDVRATIIHDLSADVEELVSWSEGAPLVVQRAIAQRLRRERTEDQIEEFFQRLLTTSSDLVLQRLAIQHEARPSVLKALTKPEQPLEIQLLALAQLGQYDTLQALADGPDAPQDRTLLDSLLQPSWSERLQDFIIKPEQIRWNLIRSLATVLGDDIDDVKLRMLKGDEEMRVQGSCSGFPVKITISLVGYTRVTFKHQNTTGELLLCFNPEQEEEDDDAGDDEWSDTDDLKIFVAKNFYVEGVRMQTDGYLSMLSAIPEPLFEAIITTMRALSIRTLWLGEEKVDIDFARRLDEMADPCSTILQGRDLALRLMRQISQIPRPPAGLGLSRIVRCSYCSSLYNLKMHRSCPNCGAPYSGT